MGEVYWEYSLVNALLTTTTWYAQTFTPLWSHFCFRVRFICAYLTPWADLQFALQYLKPDGTPTGADLAVITVTPAEMPGLAQDEIINRTFPQIRVVEGINYALVIRLTGLNPLALWRFNYKPPPSNYPRGKLIVSNNAGLTWDTTDRGDMIFGEYGDPPLKPTPYLPPVPKWAIGEMSYNSFSTAICLRVATTSPAKLQCLYTDVEPVPVYTTRRQRGVERQCLDYYTFAQRHYKDQLERWDSMYHTFHLTGLQDGVKYWFTFTAESALNPTTSVGPIFDFTFHKGPPKTNTRRPDAPGDLCTIPSGIPDPCPDHWKNVDEATPDEWASYVMNNIWYTSYFSDLYNIPDLPPPTPSPIDEVHVTARVARQGGYAWASSGYILIKTHGTIYQSVRFTNLSTAFYNKHWHLKTNPFTNLPWTLAEIDALQIGIKLRSVIGVGWQTSTACTQLYCKVIYQCEAYY